MIKEIKKIISEVLEIDIDNIHDDLSPENNSNWDSIRHMELLTSLEEKFNLSFELEEMMEMVSFSSMMEILKKKING